MVVIKKYSVNGHEIVRTGKNWINSAQDRSMSEKFEEVHVHSGSLTADDNDEMREVSIIVTRPDFKFCCTHCLNNQEK